MRTTPCILWPGHRDAYGYGRMAKGVHAHRAAYEQNEGPIPEGWQLHHICFMPDCVNVDHLRLVEPWQNRRWSSRPDVLNAAKTECHRGHPFTPENTYVCKRGRRNCKACRRIAQRKYRNRLVTDVS